MTAVSGKGAMGAVAGSGTTPGAPAGTAAAGSPKAAKAAPRKRRSRFAVRLIPVLIFIAVLMLGIRVRDVWMTIESGYAARPVQAQAPTPPQAPAGGARPAAATSPTAATPVEPAGGSVSRPAASAQAPTNAAAGARDPLDAAISGSSDRFSDVQQEFLRRLAERRAELDRRERQLDQKAALLTAAELRVDGKIQDLERLKREIQGLVIQAEQLDQQETERLVGVYESMRPADAARIMGALELPVLLEVLGKMRTTKASPILAAMDVERAREVTQRLAERRQLPSETP